MAGNAMSDVVVTAEEIATALSAELQRAITQIIALKIENAKLREKISDFANKPISPLG